MIIIIFGETDNITYYSLYYEYSAEITLAWRHSRENHRCEEISPCPYRGEILLERRRFSNVNQIDEEFDPDTHTPFPALESKAAAEEGKHSVAETASGGERITTKRKADTEPQEAQESSSSQDGKETEGGRGRKKTRR